MSAKETTVKAAGSAISYKKIVIASALLVSGAYVGYYFWSRSGRKSSLKKPQPKEKLPEDLPVESVNTASDPLTDKQEVDVVALEDEKQDEAVVDDPISSYTSEKFLELARESRIKGNKYFNASKFDKAIECYTEAIRMYPEGDEGLVLAYSNRAACYIKKEEYNQVIEDCNKSLLLKPDFVKALDRRSRAFESLHRYDDAAIDILTMWYIEGGKSPENDDKLQRLLMLSAENKTTQVKDFPQKLPSPIVVSEKLNIFGIKLPKIDEDEAFLSEEIKNNPVTRGDAHCKRGILHLAAGRYNEAFVDLENSVSLKTENFYEHSHYLFALFSYLKNDMKNAMLHIEKAISNNPKSIISIVLRASWKFELEQVSDAMEDISRCIEYDPNNALPYVHRSVFVSIFNPLGAISDAEKAIELDLSLSSAHIQLARIHMMMEDVPSAIKVLGKAMKVLPDEFEILNCYNELIVSVPFEMSSVPAEEASKSVEKAIKLKPFDPRSYVTKGTFCLKQQDFEKAISCVTKAIEVEPTFQFPYFELAMILVAQSRYEEAKKFMYQGLDMASSEKELLQSYRLVVDLETQMAVLSKFPQFLEIFK